MLTNSFIFRHFATYTRNSTLSLLVLVPFSCACPRFDLVEMLLFNSEPPALSLTSFLPMRSAIPLAYIPTCIDSLSKEVGILGAIMGQRRT